MSTLVITDLPTKSGAHLELMRAIFDSHGEEFEVVNVLPAMSDKELAKVKPAVLKKHSKRLWQHALEHDRVLCAGKYAAASFFRSNQIQAITKERGRGYMHRIGKYTVCTYSPRTCVKDTDFFRDLVFDTTKLLTNDTPMEQPEIEIVEAQTKKEVKELLADLHEASFVACDIETTGFDPTTNDILAIAFACLLEDGSPYVVVVPQTLVGREVSSFLRTYKGTQIWHNGKFDLQHVWRKFGRFTPHRIVDTMLMNWVLDERPFNRYKAHSLKLMARLHFDGPEYDISMGAWLEEYFRPDPDSQKVFKWLMGEMAEHPVKAKKELKNGTGWTMKQFPKEHWRPPSEERKQQMWDEMLTYMGMDAAYTALLYPRLCELIDDESLRLWDAHHDYDMPASLSLANMELTGAPIDVPYLLKVRKELVKILEEEIEHIRALISEHTVWKHDKGEPFNPRSQKQVVEVLYGKTGLNLKMPRGVGRYAYKRDDDEVTTNSDTLKVLSRIVKPKRPAVASLIDKILLFRQRSLIVGTYIDGILDRIDPDGRVRGDFNIHGTATARISCSNPNLQNIPDASHVGYDIRKAYIPTPGWVNLEADYSQLELRVAALFSQDEVMLQAYRDGADIHQEVALLLFNKPKKEITKYERYLAKCMNFGVIYGRGARSIATGPEMDNLMEEYGRSWSNAEIDAYFAKFKVGYKDLFTWMDLVKKDSMAKQYVENPCGHRRRFDLILESERSHIERQTVNTPIQGFAARMTIHALTHLDKKFDPEKQQILFTVHDSIVCQCIAEKKIIKETAEIIQQTMEEELPTNAIMSLPALEHSPHQMGDPLTWNLPFVADVGVGKNWSECKYDPFSEKDLAKLLSRARQKVAA